MRSELKELVRETPEAHPVSTYLRYTDYDLPPPPFIQDWLDRIYQATIDGPTDQALFAPRGYSKTVSTIEVCPAWFVLNWPEIRIAIVSHKAQQAGDRAKLARRKISETCDHHDISIAEESKTTIRTEANGSKEPTLRSKTIRSDDEGSHYDVVIYDDIATWGNQTTAFKSEIQSKFKDWIDNKTDKQNASCLPNGSINIVIGTRKIPDDLYQQEILTDDLQWSDHCAPHAGNHRWQARCWRVTPDWHVIENESYQIRGSDGEIYDRLSDVPRETQIIDVEPEESFRVLWEELDPADDVLQSLVTTPSHYRWRSENQQTPTEGEGVLSLDWLRFDDPIPRDDWDSYRWYAGLDFANPGNNPASKRSSTSDYWALAIDAYDPELDVHHIVDVRRDRGYMWQEAATEMVGPALESYPIGSLLIESNFDGKEIADVMDEELDLSISRSSSQGDKDQRLRRFANQIQQGAVKIRGDPSSWESFIKEEWLPFPNAEHDDRFDAMEIASRGPSSGVERKTAEDFNIQL